jgi:hypothetical protein
MEGHVVLYTQCLNISTPQDHLPHPNLILYFLSVMNLFLYALHFVRIHLNVLITKIKSSVRYNTTGTIELFNNTVQCDSYIYIFIKMPLHVSVKL